MSFLNQNGELTQEAHDHVTDESLLHGTPMNQGEVDAMNKAAADRMESFKAAGALSAAEANQTSSRDGAEDREAGGAVKAVAEANKESILTEGVQTADLEQVNDAGSASADRLTAATINHNLSADEAASLAASNHQLNQGSDPVDPVDDPAEEAADLDQDNEPADPIE